MKTSPGKLAVVALLLTTIGFSAPQFASAKAPTKEEKALQIELDKARELLAANRKDEAEKFLKELCLKNPQSKEAKLLHGIAFYDQDRLHAAQDLLLELTKEDPCPYEAWLYLARSYQKIGKLPLSIEAYKKFLEVVPKNFEEKDKYGTLISLLENQNKEEMKKPLARRGKGDYLGDVTEQGIFRWAANRMPIKVYIKSGEDVPGYRYDFDESIRDAFDQWQIKTRGKIRFVLQETPDNADFIVNWTNDLKSKPFHAELGHAKLESDGEGIRHAELELLTVDPFKEGPVGKRLMRNVCLHEVGHALGLQGHSPYKDDIMFPQLSVQDGISDRDLNTLMTLYQDDARDKILNASPTIKQHSKSRQAAIFANEGSRLAVSGNYKEAYELLKKALTTDPKVEQADLIRRNLGAITNNLAIKEEDPKEAVRFMHESLFYDDKDSARTNLDIFLDRIGVDPKDFAQRLKLSDQCLATGDRVGALIELKEALKLKEDKAAREKLSRLEAELNKNAESSK